MIETATHMLYRIGREQGFTGDDYTNTVRLIDRERLVNAALDVADIEKQARCMTSQWHELADGFNRVAEAADLVAALAGHPERAPEVACRALAYARHLHTKKRCMKRRNFDAARRWDDKAVVELEAMMDLTK